MVIIADSLTQKTDEGYAKVANNLALKLKKDGAALIDISGQYNSLADYSIKTNKFLLDKRIKKICKNENVLYICQLPSIGKTLKLFFLKHYCKCKNLSVIFIQVASIKFISRILTKKSKSNIIVLSKKTKDFLSKWFKNIHLIKTGVDTNKFKPVDDAQKKLLRQKYKLSLNDKIILHVGHLKQGRNVELFSKLHGFTKLLVVSTSTGEDIGFREKITANDNFILFDEYISAIEEIYQLSDCYVFLVDNSLNCIDMPLSVIEACACNLPVISTSFKDLDELSNDSFIVLKDLNTGTIEESINKVINLQSINNRNLILDFDWNKSIDYLKLIINGKEESL